MRFLLFCLSTYAPQGPELPPTHLAAAVRVPNNCSPRSALTWEDWLQAAACSSREQVWRRARGGNNLTPDPPPPRLQHELRIGFRKREEKHSINYRRKGNWWEQGRAGETRVEDERGLRKWEGECRQFKVGRRLESFLGWCLCFMPLFWKSGNIQPNL